MATLCFAFNRSNREFFFFARNVVHEGEKCKKLSEKCQKKLLFTLRLQSGGSESDNKRVYTDPL